MLMEPTNTDGDVWRLMLRCFFSARFSSVERVGLQTVFAASTMA